MKTKIATFAALPAFAAMPLAAAIYTSDFTGLGLEESVEGVDGWQLSEPNYEDGIFEYYRAFGSSINGQPAAAVGGFYDTFATDSGEFYVYRALTVDLSQNFSFSMTFAFADSDDFGPNRSQFTIGFYDGTTEFFSLVFRPVLNEVISPDYPEGEGLWTVFTSTGGVISESSIGLAAQTGQPYLFNFSSTSDGTYNYSVGSSLLTFSGEGLLDDLAGSSITELRVGMALEDGQDEFGSNVIIFNGITAIPEPSGLLLATSGALAAIFRRRR